jgi:hypothetical protein
MDLQKPVFIMNSSRPIPRAKPTLQAEEGMIGMTVKKGNVAAWWREGGEGEERVIEKTKQGTLTPG